MIEDRPARPAEFAWEHGDRPGSLGFGAPVDPAVRAALLKGLPPDLVPSDSDEVRIGALTGAPGPAGRYWLRTADGEWFLRLTTRWGDAALESAIMAHLERWGAPINPLITCGISVQVPGVAESMRLDVRPFVGDAAHFSGADDELRSLGRSLAAVHEALRSFPEAARVRSAARARSARWDRLHRMACDDPSYLAAELPPYGDWIARHRDWIAETARICPPSELLEAGDAQCLHGEPHPANVLFRDSRAVLLDFEEAVHLHASPRWDLAFAVQRFMMADDPGPAALNARLDAFEAGYGAPAFDPGAMRTVAWCTVLLIFDLWHEAGIVTPTAEVAKFKRLIDQAAAAERPA